MMILRTILRGYWVVERAGTLLISDAVGHLGRRLEMVRRHCIGGRMRRAWKLFLDRVISSRDQQRLGSGVGVTLPERCKASSRDDRGTIRGRHGDDWVLLSGEIGRWLGLGRRRKFCPVSPPPGRDD